MLYINLSDSSIEVIETKKKIIGKEVVSALSRKDIPEGLIVDGKIKEADKLLLILRDVFISAYPKEIKDKVGSLSVSDREMVSFRLLLPLGYKDSDLAKKIIEEAVKILPKDPNEFEHFYKENETVGQTREVLYTAMLKYDILQYVRLFEIVGIKLKFLSPRSFAVFELLKYLDLTSEKILYCDLGVNGTEYTLFDKYGFRLAPKPKALHKTSIAEIKDTIKQVSEKQIDITRIIVGGAGSIEIHAKEISEDIKLPVVKMGELIDNILERSKLSFETGGTAKMLVASSAGLMMLVHSREAPNFVKDLEFIKKGEFIPQREEVKVVEKDIFVTEIPDKKEKIETEIVDQYRETSIISDEIVEHKKSDLLTILGSKFFLIIISVILVFGLLLSISSFFGKRFPVIPFSRIPAPSFTPVPSVLPSLTPTPSIDETLKRSDLVLSVQNGTEKAGYAKETAGYLEDKEYTKITAGNADKDDYETSVIKIKEEKKKYLPLLINDLKDKIDTSTVASLSAEEKYDAVIILGKK